MLQSMRSQRVRYNLMIEQQKQHFQVIFISFLGSTLPGNLTWLSGKESVCQCRIPGSIPGSGRSPGEGNGIPLQYSCLENPMDGGAWWATFYGSQRVGRGLAKQRTQHRVKL